MFAGAKVAQSCEVREGMRARPEAKLLFRDTNQFQFEFTFIFVSDFELPIPKFLASPALTYIGPRSNIQDCHTSVMNQS